ncbi:MAG: LamG domain-containing protein, partial [Anaerolineae bacterium]
MTRLVPAAFEHSLALNDSPLQLTDDYVEIPHDPALVPYSDAITLEAWVSLYPLNLDACNTVISKDLLDSYWLGICNQHIRYYSNGDWQDGSTVIPAHVWTHIAVVWEHGDQRHYYLNGELEYTGDAGPTPAVNAYPVAIGADPGPSADLSLFAGNIAEVRLWTVARSQDEIRRTMHIALDEPRPGLVAVWHLADDYNDSIGEHHGAPRGQADLNGPAAPPQPALVPLDESFNTLPTTRSGAATVYIPGTNQAWLLGGSRGGAVSDQIEAVDAATGATSAVGNLPLALNYAAAAYAPDNDTIYVFGGQAGVNYQNTIYAVSRATGAVRTLAPTLPVSVRSAAAVYHPDLHLITIIGGYSGSVQSRISVFDPETETLSSPPGLTLPAPRYNLAAAYAGATGKIYLFGGLDGSLDPTSTIYELALDDDGLGGSVSLVAGVALPVETYAFAAVEDPASRLIYLLGGVDVDRVLVFDPATAQLWPTLIPLPEERLYASVIYSSRNRHALLMGGWTSGNRASIWRAPLGDGPAIPLGRWDFPMTVGDAVNAIDGDETRVVVATYGSGAYRYNANSGRTRYTPADLGSASGIINDVRYDAVNDETWLATDDAGGKQITSAGAVTTFDAGVLGANRVLAVAVQPGATSADSIPFFGTDGQGLRWRDRILWPFPGYQWHTNFVGSRLDAIALRTEPVQDVWVIADGGLRRMQFDPFYTETNYSGSQCNLFEPDDLALGPNSDWWVVSPNYFVLGARPDVDGQGVCRIPGAVTPGAGNLLEPLLGVAAAAVDVDADGRIWTAVEAQPGESGGLVAYQAVGAPPNQATLYTEEYNWTA